MSSIFFAGTIYIAQTHVQSLGKSKDEREDFLEKRLTPESIGKAAFQRSTYATLLPSLIDTGAFFTGQDPMFNYRTTGLDTNLVTGNPTYDLIVNKIGGAINNTGKAIFNDDYDFSKRDAYKWKSIAPFQNMIGITNILQFMIDESDLPSRSK